MWSTVATLLALSSPAAPPRLVVRDGSQLPLAVQRWRGVVGPAERTLLDRAVPPVLDVGCGPGRVAGYLATSGVPALGVDIAAAAVRMTRSRGAAAVQRSVFDPLPGEGTWGSAVLLDGNIGIGGDPPALLARLRRLLEPRGRLLVEVEPPGTASRRMPVRLAGHPGPWQWWAVVAVDDLQGLAAVAGLRVVDHWEDDGRWFAQLHA